MKRALSRILVILSVASACLVGFSSAATAAYSNTPVAGWRANGTVWAIAASESRVFLGGEFTALTNTRTGETVPRQGLAALDRTTSELIRDWRPSVDQSVRAMALSADGAKLFVGGDFSLVNGVRRNRMAALSPIDGDFVPGWNSSVSGTVRDITVNGDTIYIGGAFGWIDGVSVRRLARLDTDTGDLVPGFVGEVYDANGIGRVWATALSPDGGSLLVGGRFTQLGGAPRQFLGAVDLETGAATPWRPQSPCGNCHIFDIATDDANVYVGMGGPGGKVVSYSGATALTRWSRHADGDVQAVATYAGKVYAGGHFGPNFGGMVRQQLAAVDAANGAVDPDFAPALVTDFPGVWALHADEDKLLVGGGFTNVGGTQQAYYAEFLDPAQAPPPPPPTETEDPTTAYSNTPVAGWRANGPVLAITANESRVFIGGEFTSLTHTVTGETVTRQGLAALDATTSELIRDWSPTVDQSVSSLALSPDGAKLFVGGDFRLVNGVRRNRLAAVSPADGQLVPGWNVSVSGTVRAITIAGDTMYIGGAFGWVDGVAMHRLARLDTSTGNLMPAFVGEVYNPSGTARVWATALSPDGGSLLVGGRFTELGGAPRQFLGAVDLETGAATPWAPTSPCDNCNIYDITTDDANVYVAMGGPGGQVVSYTGGTGELLWSVYGDGDVQAVEIHGGQIFVGGHFGPSFGGVERHQLAAVDAATGAVDPHFAPAMVNDFPGVLAMYADADQLLVGGGFTAVGDAQQAHFAEFRAS